MSAMSVQSLDEKTQEFEGNDLDSSSNKRMKVVSIDRLSALPDGILIYILSFLGMEKSAVTSILSKRWRFIWAELPELYFYGGGKWSLKRREFVHKINRILLIHAGIHLEKFDVYFKYDESFASDIDSWLDFVLENKVKEVSLRLKDDKKDGGELYSLPETMFCNSSLTSFSVQGCLLETLTKIEWKSLAWLEIDDSELSQEVVESILAGCPVLHTLALGGCWGFSCLEVKSCNLYKLKVHDREDEENVENGPLLEISAPYVRTLDLSFNPEGRTLRLMNTKSLVKAQIDISGYWFSDLEEVMSTTKELFEIVKDVEDLDLGRHYFRVVTELVVDGWQLPISGRRCLHIESFSQDEHNISGILEMLRTSPNLEGFSIEGFESERETWDEAAPGDLGCNLLHLKSVRINEFADTDFGGEPMLTVARTLLKRATSLEEMAIKCVVPERSVFIEIGKKLLTYPRSSGKALIRFKNDSISFI